MAFNIKRLHAVAKCPSVHDLATTYGRLHQGTIDIETYEAGAIEIINRIEKCIDPPYLISAEQAYYNVKKLIEELKSK